MADFVYLRDMVVILAFGVLIVTVFHRFKLPSIAGFILSGIIVGPQGLGLVNDVHNVEVLAEVGVALLLFGIGLELSTDKLRRLWKLVLVGGLFQVGLSIAAVYIVSKLFGLENNAAIFLGFLIALSSTAIVLRGLQRRGEVDAPHGRLTLGILVFQDFSVVPMMLALPLLSGSGDTNPNFILTIVQSIAIVAGVLIAARLVVPRVLNFIARTRQRQLFIISIFLICIGTAWLITSSGASLAIGAFLAGLVVAGSEYRHQALADLISFREVFASLFFVSIGMLLALSTILENITIILLLLATVLIGKSLVVFITSMILRLPLRVGLLASVALAQIGEFSFVLLFAAQGTGLIDKSLESTLIATAILSMFLTPFALSFGPRLAAGVGKIRGLTRMFEITPAKDAGNITKKMRGHVIIGGYGFAGQQLAEMLGRCNIPYVIVDLNVDNIRKASLITNDAYFGDVTSEDVLHELGVENAKEFVVLINDPSATERAVKTAHRLAPDLHIAARTYYLLDIEPLERAGADEVIPAEREAAVKVTSHILGRHRTDPDRIEASCSEIRRRTEEETA